MNKNAKTQLKRLEKGTLSLDHLPKRFKLYQDALWHDQELRVMPVDNFLVFYISDNQKQVITILRIMYHGRDISKELHNSQLD